MSFHLRLFAASCGPHTPSSGHTKTWSKRPFARVQSVAAAIVLIVSGTAHAQMTPVGTWHSVDDESKQPKAQIVITQGADGVLTGRIEKLLRPGADAQAVCGKCSDDRKDKPIVGMEIIRGAQQVEGQNVWEGGRILDPEKGSTYSLRLTPTDGGAKLQVRGSLGPFGRTQTWVRVQ